jgi:hypothetical protein
MQDVKVEDREYYCFDEIGFFFLLVVAALSIFTKKGSILCFIYYLFSVTIHASGWISGYVSGFGWFVDCFIWIPILE